MSATYNPSDPESVPPVFDATRLDYLLDLEEEGDHAMVKDIARQFINDISEVITRIGKSVTEGDYSRVAGDAHTVKGSAASFGLYHVERVAKQLEACAKKNEHAEIPAFHETLRDAFTAGCDAMNAYLAGK